MENEEDRKPKKTDKTPSHTRWVIRVFLIAVSLSAAMSLCSGAVLEDAGYVLATLTLLLFTARRPGSTAMQVHILSRTEVDTRSGSPLRHSSRSPQKQGRFPYAIRGRPESAGAALAFASLQHPPQTGRKKQAPKASQLCPLKDF